MHPIHADWMNLIFSQNTETQLTKFHFVLEYKEINNVKKNWKNFSYFIKQIYSKIAFVSLGCDRNMDDAISIIKMSENTKLHLVFSLGIFLVKMMSLRFLSQSRDTQAIFYLLIKLLYKPNMINKIVCLSEKSVMF